MTKSVQSRGLERCISIPTDFDVCSLEIRIIQGVPKSPDNTLTSDKMTTMRDTKIRLRYLKEHEKCVT